MTRAGIFIGDSSRRVRVVGAHGTSFEQLAALRPTLIDTPIAQRALSEDEVVVVTEDVDRVLPPQYAEVLGITTLVCTPMSAAGRGYGVICADRGGGPFELTDGERHLLWTLGKTAALVTTARRATRQQERSRRLSERLELAREIHERVLQRMFGVSLALSSARPLSGEQRERCRTETQEAIGELRRALERPLAPVPRETATTLVEELERLRSEPGIPVRVTLGAAAEVPPALESLAQSVLAEALRNVAKHASPAEISVEVGGDADTFVLQVRNDGVPEGVRGTGMGLRLAGYEALQMGGVIEFGPDGPGFWRVRLMVPRAGGGGIDTGTEEAA
jgi:signal transduction histidine kinase